jgi:DNA invertase Pin-like site-specific DNA recombinase
MIETMMDRVCFGCNKPMGQKPGIPGTKPTSSLCPECNTAWYAQLEERKRARCSEATITPLEILEYFFALNYGVADIAHKTGVSYTTIYRILNYEGGYSKSVRAKLRKAYDKSIEISIFEAK